MQRLSVSPTRVVALSLILMTSMPNDIVSAKPFDGSNDIAAANTGAAGVKTYKVTLTKSSEGTNRDVFVQARDSDEAGKTAKAQNPGWEVLLVVQQK